MSATGTHRHPLTAIFNLNSPVAMPTSTSMSESIGRNTWDLSNSSRRWRRRPTRSLYRSRARGQMYEDLKRWQFASVTSPMSNTLRDYVYHFSTFLAPLETDVSVTELKTSSFFDPTHRRDSQSRPSVRAAAHAHWHSVTRLITLAVCPSTNQVWTSS